MGDIISLYKNECNLGTLRCAFGPADVFLPICSAFTFRYFACSTYQDGNGRGHVSILRIDPTIHCNRDTYKTWLPYVVCSLAIWPLGIPLLMATVLWRHRAQLNPAVSSPQEKRQSEELGKSPKHALTHERNAFQSEKKRHFVAMSELQKLEIRDQDDSFVLRSIKFLYEDFEPRCFMFGCFEVTRRIFLTGALTLFYDGTISQIAIGLLGSMISKAVYSHYAPYIEDDDDAVSEVAQSQLVLIFFGAMMVYATENLEQKDVDFSGVVFGVILICIFAATFVTGIWYILVGIFGASFLTDSCAKFCNAICIRLGIVKKTYILEKNDDCSIDSGIHFHRPERAHLPPTPSSLFVAEFAKH